MTVDWIPTFQADREIDAPAILIFVFRSQNAIMYSLFGYQNFTQMPVHLVSVYPVVALVGVIVQSKNGRITTRR
jgi:hypothetical protein